MGGLYPDLLGHIHSPIVQDEKLDTGWRVCCGGADV